MYFWPLGGSATSSKHSTNILSIYEDNFANRLANVMFIQLDLYFCHLTNIKSNISTYPVRIISYENVHIMVCMISNVLAPNKWCHHVMYLT